MKCRTSWNAHCPCRHRAARDRFGRARLETKNDESRFGLTRAPFLKRRGSLERGQSLVRHRVAKSGIESTLSRTLVLCIHQRSNITMAGIRDRVYLRCSGHAHRRCDTCKKCSEVWSRARKQALGLKRELSGNRSRRSVS